MHDAGVDIAGGSAKGESQGSRSARHAVTRRLSREGIVLGVAPGRAVRGLGSADDRLTAPVVVLGCIWRPTEMLAGRAPRSPRLRLSALDNE